MGDEQVDDPIREQYARPVREHEQLLQDNDAALEAVRTLRDHAREQGKETPTTDGMVDYLQDKHDQGTPQLQHERDNLDLYDQMTQPSDDGTLGQIDPTNPYEDTVQPIDTTSPYAGDGGGAGDGSSDTDASGYAGTSGDDSSDADASGYEDSFGDGGDGGGDGSDDS